MKMGENRSRLMMGELAKNVENGEGWIKSSRWWKRLRQMMGGGGETVEARPGHSGGLGKPGGDEYIQAVWETTKNIRSGYLTSHIPTFLPTCLSTCSLIWIWIWICIGRRHWRNNWCMVASSTVALAFCAIIGEWQAASLQGSKVLSLQILIDSQSDCLGTQIPRWRSNRLPMMT